MQYLNQLLPAQLQNKLQLSWDSVRSNVDESVLSNKELEWFSTFSDEGRKAEFLVGRYLAKEIAGKMGMQPDELVIQKDEEGKPVAAYQGKEYFLSLSHSDEKVLCALSAELPVGVDIEPTNRQITTELRERIMSDDEVQTLQGVNTLRIWTMKEALLKLYGKKLGSSLRECVINPSDTDIYESEVKEQVKVNVFSQKYENYWVAIAWQS